jgi:hypothetical protein
MCWPRWKKADLGALVKKVKDVAVEAASDLTLSTDLMLASEAVNKVVKEEIKEVLSKVDEVSDVVSDAVSDAVSEGKSIETINAEVDVVKDSGVKHCADAVSRPLKTIIEEALHPKEFSADETKEMLCAASITIRNAEESATRTVEALKEASEVVEELIEKNFGKENARSSDN